VTAYVNCGVLKDSDFNQLCKCTHHHDMLQCISSRSSMIVCATAGWQ
jgi:hypothetical protein